MFLLMCIYNLSLSICLSVYLSVDPSIFPSVHRSIHLSIDPLIHLSIYLLTYIHRPKRSSILRSQGQFGSPFPLLLPPRQPLPSRSRDRDIPKVMVGTPCDITARDTESTSHVRAAGIFTLNLARLPLALCPGGRGGIGRGKRGGWKG